jgi:nucleoside-diphosphate-sugar epimerase
VATLVHEGVDVVAFDLGTDDRRLRLTTSPEELERVAFVRGDLTDLAAVDRALVEHGITHIVHLAALQVPFWCSAPR